MEGLERLQIDWQGLPRAVDIFVPGAVRPARLVDALTAPDKHDHNLSSAPLPVVIMFHGGGGTSELAIKQTGLCQKSEREKFIAVFPNGAPLNPERPQSFLRNPQVWNSGVERGIPQAPNTDDVGFINELLDVLCQRYPVDKDRIFAAGFSNGGGMAWRLAIELSERFAAIAPVCAYLSLKNPLHQKQPVSALIIACEDDPLVPLEGGMVRDIWSKKNIERPSVRLSVERYAALLGCDTKPLLETLQEGVVKLTYQPGQHGTAVEFIIISDAGHAYPGGAPMLSERIAGKSTDKISATEAIWSFFARHRALKGQILSFPD
jgi:polyhydroxybutyrate depolymerase